MSNVLQNTGGNTLKVHGASLFGSAAAPAVSDVVMGLRNFYVAKTGSDANDGSSGSPVLTLLKATQLATTAGDAVHIGAGTYSEDSGVNWFSYDATVTMLYSGTLANPITFQAASGDVGSVIIDCLTTNVGILTNHKDYCHFRNLEIKNCKTVGIVNANTGVTSYASVADAQKSTGVVIAGCYIHHVDGITNENIAAIRGDHTVDWEVRNCHLDYMSEDGNTPALGDHTSGFQAYSTKNLLLENNLIERCDAGVLLKDHWLGVANAPLFEAEIRYNDIRSTGFGVSLITGNSEPLGDTYVHHNIINGPKKSVETNCVAANNSYLGGYLDVQHNLLMASGLTGSRCIDVDTGTDLDVLGNIMLDATNATMITARNRTDDVNCMIMTSSNYNIFDDVAFQVTLGRNGTSESIIDYTSLTAWQAVQSTAHSTISFNDPDANSNKSNETALFNLATSTDFTLKVGSMALAFMPDSSNAGPYQAGTETIGLTGGGAY